jgi:NAD(P)-dependent dehydrogenase (short-subunit alcohol dehydrogenase family)
MTSDAPATDSDRLSGKVALVTGGASGIGLATARRLAEAGAVVAIADRDSSKGERVAGETGWRYFEMDVSESSAWSATVAEIEASFGGLDIAYLNAGVGTGESDLVKVTDEQYRRIMHANVDGVFFGARAVTPALERRGGGAIVATASIAGLIAYAPDPVYCLTKHAVVGIVRALAPQLATKHITINAICPGIVDTPMIGDEGRQMLEAANFPMIPARDIAEAVYARVIGEDTGKAWVVQVGLEATAYRFSGVPGPRGQSSGKTPPHTLAGDLDS